MKKFGIILSAALTLLMTSCLSTGGSKDDVAIADGVRAWNKREPAAAEAFWQEIEDAKVQKKWLNNITLYNAGVAQLDKTENIKASNESALLSACNAALDKFSQIDEQLELPEDVCVKGIDLSAGRIDKLLAQEKVSAAKKMYNQTVSAYGEDDVLKTIGEEVNLVSSISSKKTSLNAKGEKALAIENFDEKIVAVDAAIASFKATEGEINSTVAGAGEAGKTDGVTANVKSFKKARQDLEVQRKAAFRDEAYSYKDRMGEEFARQPAEGSGSGKNGTLTVYDIRDHYKSVGTNMDSIYAELEAFAAKYPKDVDKTIIAEAQDQKKDLNDKIAQINKEIAIKEEIESRGKTVMPLMIGLFNPMPGSTAKDAKSRPAKLSAKGQKGNEYWWGMVSIPKGQMNDLVITMKDNRNIRVFNRNTHSGKDIEKNNMKDLVSKANKVGNSWPVLNAGKALNGDKYFIEIQKGKTDSYEGEVVVYSSFITRSR